MDNSEIKIPRKVRNEEIPNNKKEEGRTLQVSLDCLNITPGRLRGQLRTIANKIESTTNITLYLHNNQIKEAGCRLLVQAPLARLRVLYISYNTIGDIGCKYLSAGHWRCLETLDLANNEIGPTGCKHLTKSHWDNLQYLNLSNFLETIDGNQIGLRGCQKLSMGRWPRLLSLSLNQNEIKKQGYGLVKDMGFQIDCQYSYFK